MLRTINLLILFCLAMSTVALADITIPMYFTASQAIGEKAGTVTISETKYGLLFMPNLSGVATGIHGCHIHVHPSCAQDGMAAGGHFDPKNTGKHLGPYNDKGHLGDLPAL